MTFLSWQLLNISAPTTTAGTTSTTASTTTTAATSGKRKRRFSVALACREIPPILDTISYYIHDGYTMGIYQTGTIIRNCRYIEKSNVHRSDCSPTDLSNLMQAYSNLEANITTATVDYLPLLKAEADLVEAERALWYAQWVNQSEIRDALDMLKFQQRIDNDTKLQNEVIY